ncbi:MAG: hypothetical protein IJO74_06580 [Clostridia bacterium]|nr:hypothetical protein [Clostridia bacterium]
MDEQMYIILYIGVIIFGIFFLFAKIKHNELLKNDAGKEDLNSDLPIVKQNAVVLSKIEPENPNGVFFGFAHILFETENNERKKLAIIDRSKYDSILIGDRGILSTKGNAFVKFEINTVIEGDNNE